MKENYKIHSVYIVAILVSIIVILLAVEWTKVEGLVEYLTFALTLSSLILAILAIVYSLISNTSVSSILHDVSRSARQVTKASQKIQASHSELQSQVSQIPDRIDILGRDLDSAMDMFKSFGTIPPIHSEKKESITTSLDEKIVRNFLERASISGLELLLMVVLSCRTSTSFSLKEFREANPELHVNDEYKHGFLVASRGIALFNVKTDSRNRWTFSNVHETLENEADVHLVEMIKEQAKQATQNQLLSLGTVDEIIERWMKIRTATYEFFDVDLPTD